MIILKHWKCAKGIKKVSSQSVIEQKSVKLCCPPSVGTSLHLVKA